MLDKNAYHMVIDQEEIWVLTSFSDAQVLKLFGNLFNKCPAWYANHKAKIGGDILEEEFC